MSLTEPQPHRWTRQEFERMAREGYFPPDARVELLDGEILDMAAMGPRHARSITLATGMLVRAFGPEWAMRVQLDLALDDYNQPVPDFALLTMDTMLDLEDHPSRVDLIIEVADSSLRYDRLRKAAAYARAGQPEYWIVNLRDRRLEVHRDPDPEAGAWRKRFELEEEAVCRPLARPETEIPVRDLLGLPPLR